MGNTRGMVLAGVGAAVLLLSACGVGGTTAAPTSSSSPAGQSSAAEPAKSGEPALTKSAKPEKPAESTQSAGKVVEVSIVTAMRDDGTVEYQVARFVPAETNNRTVEPVDGTDFTAELAPNAEFLSTQGCDVEHAVGLALDQQGLGAVPCERDAYAKMTPTWTQYAPTLFFDGAGKIVKMANHYHP